MTCCGCGGATFDGASGGGGGGGTPDEVISLSVTTESDVPVFVRLADLPAAGDSVNMMLIVSGTLMDAGAEGEDGYNLVIWQKAATSANGTQGNQAGVIGPDGYQDPVLAPWSTVGGVPAGWGGIVPAVTVGTEFGVTIIGAVATTIRWDFGGSRIFGGTAAP